VSILKNKGPQSGDAYQPGEQREDEVPGKDGRCSGNGSGNEFGRTFSRQAGNNYGHKDGGGYMIQESADARSRRYFTDDEQTPCPGEIGGRGHEYYARGKDQIAIFKHP